MAPSNLAFAALFCAALVTPSFSETISTDEAIQPRMDTTEGFVALSAEDQPELLRFMQDFKSEPAAKMTMHKMLRHAVAAMNKAPPESELMASKRMKLVLKMKKNKGKSKGKRARKAKVILCKKKGKKPQPCKATKFKHTGRVFETIAGIHHVNLKHYEAYWKASHSYKRFGKGKSKLFRDLYALEWLIRRGAEKLPRAVFATGGPGKIDATIYPNSPGGKWVNSVLKKAKKHNRAIKRKSTNMYFSNDEEWGNYWSGLKGCGSKGCHTKGLKDGKFAVDFKAKINLKKSGEYTFWTTSDDGSLLYVDGHLVVNNDKKHVMRTRGGRIKLRKGKHKVEVKYVGAGGLSGLHVVWSGVDFKQQRFPGMLSVAMLQQRMMTRYLQQVFIRCTKARKLVVNKCVSHLCKYHHKCSSSTKRHECKKLGHMRFKKALFSHAWYEKNPNKRFGYFSRQCVGARHKGFGACQKEQKLAYKTCHTMMSKTAKVFTGLLLKHDKETKKKIFHAERAHKAGVIRRKARAYNKQQAKQLAQGEKNKLRALAKADARDDRKKGTDDAVTPLLHKALPLGNAAKLKGMATKRALHALDKTGRKDEHLSLYKKQKNLFESMLYEEDAGAN